MVVFIILQLDLIDISVYSCSVHKADTCASDTSSRHHADHMTGTPDLLKCLVLS